MTVHSIPAQLAGACEEVRPATEADAVAGVQPALVASPATTEQASSVLRAAAALGLAVIPRGTGTKLDWGNPPERADLVVDTTRLDQVVEHAAGDLVATVQAGVRLEQFADVLSVAGQRLALDPPARPAPYGAAEKTRGTVGGVLATNDAGPLRLRYGTPRDLLIGITIVRADGTIAKSGGKVVKNVAGYDLGKLFAGSRGTLGLITQATFRLHPIPAATAYVTVACDSAAACARLLATAQQASIAPVAAELHRAGPAEPIMLAVAIEGDVNGVAQRSEILADALEVDGASPVAAVASQPPVWWGGGAAAQPDGTVLQVAFWAGKLGSVLRELEAAAARTGLDQVLGGSAASGVLHVAFPANADPAKIASLVTGLRAAQPGPSSVVVLHAPPAVRELTDLFGPVPSLRLMRAVKHQFDPDRSLSPGRFAGGI
jgi:glycolate oxidase FAD binding subunit